MSNYSQNNKRIAKNTIILYVRTLLVMVISLYTSRLILEALGEENYGIYNVVGSVVAMFSVISSSLTTATSRFITYEIGKGNKERLKTIFSTSIAIQFTIAVTILILSEIIGIWFIDNYMKIPPERLFAAKWVLQFSIVTFCLNLLCVPYNACIVAHEHMSTFAYMGIFDALGRLTICYLVATFSSVDSLILYAVLLMLFAIISQIIYIVYCKRNFEESHVRIDFDKSTFKEMLGFSGWNFFNSTAYILNNQGTNMLMNVFFGTTVNAARGIAVQVENSVLRFVNNLTIAINPQITKSYASGMMDNMYKLVCYGAKFSYFSMLFISLPLIIEAEQILEIWLVDVPEHAVAFVQLSLIMGMCDCLGNSGYTACMATGKLKRYSIVITSIGILEFPLAWICFSLGAIPEAAYYTYIIIKITVLIARMFLLKSMVGLKVSMYIREVFLPIIRTSIIAIVPPIVLYSYVNESFMRIVAVSIISVISTLLSVFYLGLTKSERDFVISKIRKNSLIHFIRK